MTLPHLTSQVCLTPRRLRDAFRLRHQSYLGKEYIEAHPEGLFFDEFDAMPGSVTFAVFAGDEIAGSIRACIYWPEIGWDEIPAALKYPQEFGDWAAKRPVIIEYSRLAVSPRFTATAWAVEVSLFGTLPFLASHVPLAGCVCAVRAHHVPFYRRLGYERISGFVKDPRLNFESTLMAMDWIQQEERLRTHRVFAQCFAVQPELEALDPHSRQMFSRRFGHLKAADPAVSSDSISFSK